MKAEVLDPATGDFREIRLRGQREPVSVEYGIADELLAPKAKVRTDVREDINAAQRLRVKDDSGDIIFEGDTRSSGTRSADGSRAVEARHDAYAVFADSVSISVTLPTDQDVLQAALNAAEGGSAFTLSYGPTPVSLGDDYDVDDRSVKRIFEDMTDRAGRVYHIGVGNTITVADSGAGGLWTSISPGDDPAQVRKYDEGDVESVINAVTVNGTAAEKVSATAEDSSSISTYGRRTGKSPYNISYISSTAEAQDMADALLEPTPQSTATVQATGGVGDITASHINETIDITDPKGTGADETLTVVGQTIQPQQTEFTLGAGGQTFATGRFNRSEKSKGDVTEPGSVYNTDRIADGAINNTKIVDLSITETKISDDAISTPKLQANAVEADKIAANSIDAGLIDVLDLDTGQLTIGNDVDHRFEFTSQSNETVLIPDGDGLGYIGENTQRMNFGYFKTTFTEQLNIDGASNATVSISGLVGGDPAVQPSTDDVGFVGTSLNAWDEMHAYEFIDASTGTALDGGDPLRGLAADPTPPDHCRVCDDDGEEVGTSIGELAKTAWEICSAQQRRIESLESAVDDLESRLTDLEAKQE